MITSAEAPKNYSGIDRRASSSFDFSDNYKTLKGIVSYLEGKPNIPRIHLDQTRRNIERAFDEYYSSTSRLQSISSDAAFYIHSRDQHVDPSEYSDEYPKEVADYLTDTGRVDPAFKPEVGLPFNVRDAIWNLIPPRRIGNISGETENGVGVRVELISVPVTPIRIFGRREGDGIGYARMRLMPSVEFAEKLGARVHGLGEAFAAMTHHGRFLQEEFPQLTFTTGHNFTAAFMEKTILEMSRKRGRDLDRTTVMFHGGNGSICTAVREDLLEHTQIGGLILHDQPVFGVTLKKQAAKLEERYPYLKGKITVTSGESQLEEACKRADMIVSAVSAPRPTLLPRYINPDTDIIDDSQPPSTLPQDRYKKGVRIAWVLGALTAGLRNTFDYGLYRKGKDEFTCALEIISKLALPNVDFETVGRVTNKRVSQALDISSQMGFLLAPAQNYGRPSF